MKRMSLVSAIVLVGMLAFVSNAFALASGPPSMDGWVDATTTNTYGTTTTFILQSSYNAGAGTCDTISTGYMKFDLSNLGNGSGGTVGYADIVMRLTDTTAAGSATVVGLYTVENDNWDETAALDPTPGLGDVKPALLGEPLTTLTVSSSTSLNTDQTFPSTQALVDFFNSQSTFVTVPTGAHDGVASLGMKISSCGTSATVRFGTRENANPPQLHLRTAAPPNAVDVSSASAERTSWPLYAGLGAVALIVVAGLAISRRRTA